MLDDQHPAAVHEYWLTRMRCTGQRRHPNLSGVELSACPHWELSREWASYGMAGIPPLSLNQTAFDVSESPSRALFAGADVRPAPQSEPAYGCWVNAV